MVEEFDKLFAISDLHLGGPPGRRAFREVEALWRFIDRVRDDEAARVALVVNGDVIDFLAFGVDAPEFNLHPDAVLHELADAKDELQPVFRALANLVAASPRERHLVIQLGNHDIELALPSAQETLRDILGARNDPVRTRLHFETAGSGWLCKIGRRLVQVVHGNAWDPWNAIDHVGLDLAARDSVRPGARLRAPKTNAGTLMVCHVLNRIKQDYPFVDLLKPEDAPLMAVMAAVDPPTSYRGLLQAFRTRLSVGRYGELLEATAPPEAGVGQGAEREVSEFLAAAPMSTGADALQRAEERRERGERARDLVPDERGQLRELRSVVSVRWQRIVDAAERMSGQPELASLRQALQRWLRPDTSFDVGRLSPIDLRIIDAALPGVDLVVAGHTHLPRQQSGAPDYINTGTWMRVLKLAGTQYLESDASFQSFFNVVGRPHTLVELDALGIDPRSRPVAVVDAKSAQLCAVHDDGSFDHPIR